MDCLGTVDGSEIPRPTTWDVWNTVNNGINCLSLNWWVCRTSAINSRKTGKNHRSTLRLGVKFQPVILVCFLVIFWGQISDPCWRIQALKNGLSDGKSNHETCFFGGNHNVNSNIWRWYFEVIVTWRIFVDLFVDFNGTSMCCVFDGMWCYLLFRFFKKLGGLGGFEGSKKKLCESIDWYLAETSKTNDPL